MNALAPMLSFSWLSAGYSLADHLWQSTLFTVVAAALTLVLPQEPRPDALLAVVHRLTEVPDSIFFADRVGRESSRAAAYRGQHITDFFCGGRNQPTICRHDSSSSRHVSCACVWCRCVISRSCGCARGLAMWLRCNAALLVAALAPDQGRAPPGIAGQVRT